LWQEVLARMACEEISLIQSSATIAREEVERVDRIWKAVGLHSLFEIWREEGDEEEQRETWECMRQALHEDGFC